jgi:hypothetical protein
MSLTLPFFGFVNSAAIGFGVSQTGTGQAGIFEINNTSSSNTALWGRTNGSGIAVRASIASGSGIAVQGSTFGTGRAGFFQITNHSNSSPALLSQTIGGGTAVYGYTSGTGGAGDFQIDNRSNASTAVWARTIGPGIAVQAFTSGVGSAGFFRIANSRNSNAALTGYTDGLGNAVQGITPGTGRAGLFQIFNTSSTSPALQAQTDGTGPALLADHTGSTGPLAVFQTAGVNQARISRTGRGFFNGGTQTGGADVAEAFEVEGEVKDYAPGDVLVVSERSDRRVEKASEPYSTRVIGVYATKPGVLLTERDIEDPLEAMVPVGVIGVIPTKVSAENGAIRRGDLLVPSGTPGHAMRAEPVEINGIKLYPTGSVLGKALEEFAGPGTGLIRVLVNVK